jgi:hypothetical protein
MIGRKKIIPNRRCIFMIKISSDHPSLPVLNLDANRYTVLRDFLAEWRIFNLRIVVIMHGKTSEGSLPQPPGARNEMVLAVKGYLDCKYPLSY